MFSFKVADCCHQCSQGTPYRRIPNRRAPNSKPNGRLCWIRILNHVIIDGEKKKQTKYFLGTFFLCSVLTSLQSVSQRKCLCKYPRDNGVAANVQFSGTNYVKSL